LPAEDQLLEQFRAASLTPGDYAFPWMATPKEMASEEFLAKRARGPAGVLTIAPSGPHRMGRSLARWFVFILVVGLFAAYVAGLSLPAGAEYMLVFRIATTVAFAAYTLALWEYAIWYERSWATTARFTFDGLVYALVTGGVFGWLWP